MNTIYSIVWNRALGEWTAVSELAHLGGGRASGKVVAHALTPRHLALAVACVLGGTLVCVPAVYAGSPATGEHQQLEKVSPRLADLGDLLVKYANAPTAVVPQASAHAVATASVKPYRTVAHAVAVRPDAAPAFAPSAAGTRVSRVVGSQTVVKPPVRLAFVTPARSARVTLDARTVSATVHDQQVRSPQLASDTQIAALLARRGAGSASSVGNVGEQTSSRGSGTWVVASDGSLRVMGAKPSMSATAVATVAKAAVTAAPVVAQPSLPAIALAPVVASVVPTHAALTVQTAAAPELAPVQTTLPTAAPPVVPVPQQPQQPQPAQPDGGRLAAILPAAQPKTTSVVQTSTLVGVDGFINDEPLLTSVNTARPDVVAAGGSASSHGQTIAAQTAATKAGNSNIPVAAMAVAPVPYAGQDAAAGDDTSANSSFSNGALASPQPFAPFGLASMALAPASPQRPPAPETPTPGLIIGTGGLIGNVGGTINPVTSALLDPSDPYYTSGALKLAKANVTTAYSGGVQLNILGIETTVPVSVVNTLSAVSGATVGTGENQHLTLLGGVTSDSYITNINNGATNGGIINSSDPAWSDTCAKVNIAGLVGVNVPCWGVNAAQNNQVIIGDGASANGSEEVVIGTGASHTLPSVNADTTFPGDGNLNSATDPMGVPDSNYQSRLGHSVVIGDSASGTQTDQTILGANATSAFANSVALGYGSDADRGALTGYINAYGLQGQAQNSAGVVAIGNVGHERQITHVAAGTDGYDAVNVLQLEGAVANVSKGNVQYDKTALPGGGSAINYGSVTLAGTVSTDGGVTNGTVVTNLHQGALSKTSTDAVNGSQLYATNQNVTTNTSNITTNTNSITTNTGNITTNTTNVTQLKEDALQWNPNIGAYDASHGTASPQKISNVADGTAATDAVNFSQLSSAVASSGAGSVKYNSTTVNGKTVYDYDGVTFAGNTSTDGGVTNGTTLSNLHQGALNALSTDAVNGSQLFATNNIFAQYLGGVTNYDGTTNTWVPPDFSVVGIDSSGNTTTGHYNNVTDAFLAVDASLTNLNKRVNNGGGGSTNPYFNANSTGTAAQAKGKDSVAMGGNTVASGIGSVAGGDSAQALSDGAVAIGQGATASNGQAVAIGPQATASGDGAVAIGDPNVATGNGAVAAGKDNTATGDGAIAIGNTNTAQGTGAVAMGNQASASADGAMALGNNAASTMAGSVALGAGSIASRANVISVGSSGHERQITNVAVGTANTDAVNVSQLKASEQGNVRYDVNPDGSTNYSSVTLGQPGASGSTTTIHNVAQGKAGTDAVNVNQLNDALAGWAQNFSNEQFNQFDHELNDLGNHAYAGIAAAMAMAGLPAASQAGKSMAAVAAGTFHGESSLAIGVSTVSDNGRWIFKLSGSDDSRGDAGGAVGVGIQW